MSVLVISPDYASHLLPLATLATAWQDAGESVVVATGPATAGIVAEFGFERADLALGRGSNPGVIRAEEQPPGEDDALRGFFAATRHGMVPTLRYQAEARRTDLLWEPVDRARAVLDVIDRVRPDQVIVDHLAFSARLALDVAGIPYADVVLGHPTALPVGDEVYGYPPAWPSAFTPPESELVDLHRLCLDIRDSFTAEWNAALRVLDPDATPSADAFAEHGDLLLLNYPASLHDPARTALLPPHAFLGSAVRAEPADDDVRRWLEADDRPVVYVSFGSFLSARGDVLATVLEALRPLGLRVAVATGSATGLPDVPADWLLRTYLPQVALLQRAAVLVTHGGNNSVTEALTAGVPMVVLPFSTDQFAGAAAIEAAGLGAALDPNTVTATDLGVAVRAVLDGTPADVARAIGEDLRRAPGRDVARAALVG
ncbi:glycosyltransferase [Nocardioides lianchengensis]|uniref:Glycosyltransferase, MGT family n=1 Tax=Nocardioides lianchengensis TaxID=1045774 RepID=A0A1G6JES6_9ACTN|nr:glycosyltransferase [Nocardioides lianchengensis]NYG12765.1 MGT family glycosyltransferase [Nocardioides lianchengensis]SDC17231.1 glycosyltransferase, MGT family [Nocardioides lianchengensis]